ncbi:MAG: hypothetical protein ACMUIM_11560 [bacterium]
MWKTIGAAPLTQRFAGVYGLATLSRAFSPAVASAGPKTNGTDFSTTTTFHLLQQSREANRAVAGLAAPRHAPGSTNICTSRRRMSFTSVSQIPSMRA